jgi:magnesium transporter
VPLMNATNVEAEAAGQPWKQLHGALQTRNPDAIELVLDSLPPWEQARAVSRLTEEDRKALLLMLPPLRAGELMELVSTTQAVDMIGELDPQQAAVIMDGMRSDRQAAVINELAPKAADAILEQMVPEQAQEARQLASYKRDTAGGIMATEYLAFPRHLVINDVLEALREYARQNVEYQVSYVYVIDGKGRLLGVLRQRDLIFSPGNLPVGEVMQKDLVSVRVDATLDSLQQMFESHKYMGLPVVDEQGRLIGVVARGAIEHATEARANKMLLQIGGIIGGEEFRTMPLYSRAGRRLAWLSTNILFNLMSAVVLALFQGTIEEVIALAIFIPIISNMCCCAGMQAVAVSMRELTLGLLSKSEYTRVVAKEAAVGLVNGLALGVMIGIIVYLWKGNFWLALVFGGSLGINTLIAVLVGGALPLLLKKFRMDPALVGGPFLNCATDVCGFLILLSLSAATVAHLHEKPHAPAPAAVVVPAAK